MTIARWLCGWVCVVSALSASAQPIDLRVVRDPAAVDYDFSWVLWFETHGRLYLREAVSDRPLPWDTPASRRWRDEAALTLAGMLEDEDDAVRAEAVLALARMGHAPLADHLLAADPVKERTEPGDPDAPPVSLLLDRSDAVRRAAWVSLGLLGTPRCQAALAMPPLNRAGELEICAQAIGIGLLLEPTAAHRRWLVARLDDPDNAAEVKRWCVWALRRHDDAAIDPVFDAALANLPSTFVMSEVLLSRGYVQRRGGADWLKDVLRYHPDVQGWAGYRALGAVPAEGLLGSTPRRLAMETRIAATLTLAHQPPLDDADDRAELLEHLRRRMVAGNSAQAMDFNRGFDTIGYAMHCRATQADLDLLYDQLRGFTRVPADDPAVLEELEEDEVPTPEDLIFRQSQNEVRAYAALASGLLIRRATQGTGLFLERPIAGRRAIEIERLKRRFGVRLMRAVADEDEPASYRAACALALGLTGDPRYAAELSAELGRLRAGDEAVLGYGLLGLALLGETRAAEPARRYVTRRGPLRGTGDRLGRHAALWALAVLGERGGEDTAAALGDAWGRDAWVSLSAARATAWAGRYDALPGMLAAASSESARWRRLAARSLGVVFDQAWPSRLSPLSVGINPALSYQFESGRQAAPPAPGQPSPPDPLAGWPRASLHALGDPVLFGAMLQPLPEPAAPEQPDPPTPGE